MQPTSKTLVLGSNGKVGRLLRSSPVKEFASNAIWHSRSGNDGHWGWDILKESPSDLKFDSILLLAGGRECTVAQEVGIAKRVCDFADGRPVIFASSQAVYALDGNPVSEASRVVASNVYSEAKLAVEEVVKDYQNGLSLRIGNFAGADMLFRAMAAGPVFLDQFEDGAGPTRSYVGPATFAKVVLKLNEAMKDGRMVSTVLNCANPGPVAMSDCLKAAGADWEWRPAAENALASLVLDTNNLQDYFLLEKACAEDLVTEARNSGWSRFN